MKRILIAAFAVASTAAFALDVDFGPAQIPDNNVAGITLSQAVGVATTSVASVTFFGLTHTWVGDVTLTLISPDGISHNLVARIGAPTGTEVGDSSNYAGDYRFIDTGGSIWTEATLGDSTYNLRSGDYAPTTIGGAAAPLSGVGAQAAGTWKIFANDQAAADTGGWQNARLTLNVVPEPVTMIALGAGLVAMARRRRK